MRRHGIVIERSGNLQVSRKQDTYYSEIEEDLSKFYCSSLRKWISIKLVKLIKLHSKSFKQQGNKTWDFFSNSQENIPFYSFYLISLIHAKKLVTLLIFFQHFKFPRECNHFSMTINFIGICQKLAVLFTFSNIVNSQGNTTCLVSMVIFKFMVETWNYNENPLWLLIW